MGTWAKKNRNPGDRLRSAYRCDKCDRRLGRANRIHCATCIRRAREGNV
jgi:hypothetical protein